MASCISRTRWVISTLTRRAALVAVLLAAALTIVLPAVPASAAIGQMWARLVIYKDDPPGYSRGHEIRVNGLVPMSRLEAAQLVASNHKVVVRLWGDDVLADDPRGPPRYLNPKPLPLGCETYYARAAPGYFYPGDDGLRLQACFRVEWPGLNEDGTIADPRDEIYAGVRLLTPGGTTLRSAQTNLRLGLF